MQMMSLAMGQPAISEEELWKSKMQVRSQSRLATDMVSNRVSRITTQEFHLNQRIEDDKILDSIDAVTIESIQSMAVKILLQGMSQLSLAVVGPIPEDGATYNELNSIYDCFSSVNQTGNH